MSLDDTRQAIFGALDGLSSAIGMIAALAIAGGGSVVVAAVALAVGSAVSMAAGEWLSDPDSSVRRASVMGAATLVGAILPAVPFMFASGIPADVACAVVTLAVAAMIAELRPGARAVSYARTVGVLTLACAAAVVTSRLAGAG